MKKKTLHLSSLSLVSLALSLSSKNTSRKLYLKKQKKARTRARVVCCILDLQEKKWSKEEEKKSLSVFHLFPLVSLSLSFYSPVVLLLLFYIMANVV